MTNKIIKMAIHTSHITPAWWRHLRGSAPPFVVDQRTFLLAHLVSETGPRNYHTLVVEIDPATFAPKAASLPFYFFGGVEYCLSAQYFDGEVHFLVSHWDRESFVVVAPLPQQFQV